MHDKKLADESGLTYPPDALVLKDTGFQGYEPPDTATFQPEERPHGCQLHATHKTINQLISKVRITVEHAIAGIKRCHTVADTFRNRRQGFVDEVMLVASGLHNLWVVTRTAETVPKNPSTRLQTLRTIKSNFPGQQPASDHAFSLETALKEPTLPSQHLR